MDTNNSSLHQKFGWNGSFDSYKILSFLSSRIIIKFLLISNFPYVFIFNLLDFYARCRWSPNAGEPLLFVKYSGLLLNILDTEKKTAILKDPVEIEEGEDLGN